MKFSELLNKAGKNAEPDKEKIRSRAKRAAGRGALRFVAGLTAAVLLVGLIAGGVYVGYMNIPIASASDIPAELAEVSPITSVRATETEGNSVSATTSFKVTTKKAMNEEEFRDAFALSPAVSYTVEKNNGNTFTVSFENGLKGNSLYTVSSMSGDKTVYSWAFQTDNRFRITGHYPEVGYFETDTAVSVDFTHSNVDNFDQYFSIYPEMSGKFSHNGRRWLFIPDSEFEPYVPYTVTVSGDIKGGDGETLGEDYVFSFMCEQAGSYVRLSYKGEGRSDCFLPSQSPAACIEYNDFEPGAADVTVYAVPSTDEFADILEVYTSSAGIASLKLETVAARYDKLMTFTADPAPASTDTYTEKAYYPYPGTFDKGYYLAKLDISGITRFHFFSVSDLAVYSMSSGGSYVIWVNDTVTGNAVEGATAEVVGAGSGITGNDGVATVTGSRESETTVLKVKTQSGSSYVGAIGVTNIDEYNAGEINYYSYVYTDSQFYRPGDDVHVWGFVLPRKNGTAAPKSVDIYTSWDDKTVTCGLKDGGFETVFTLSGTTPDNYGMIEIQSGGRRITSTAFEVIDHDLPIYTVDVSTDKNAYFEGQEIMYTVKVAHFDKTPAQNVSVHVMGNEEDTYVETDENGFAHYLTTAVFQTYDDHGENNGAGGFGLSFSVVEPDGNSLTAYRDVAVFASSVTAEEKRDGSTVEISLWNVDVSGLNAQRITTPYGIYEKTADPASYRAGAREASVRVELHRVGFVKEELESHVNPVTMQVERIYDYTQTDDVESEGTVTAEGGKFSLQLPEAKDEGESYYYYIFTEDDDGRTLCARTSNAFYYSDYAYESTGYSLETDKEEYTEGDTVKFKLKKDSDGSDVAEGRFLASGVNCEVLENKVFDAPDGELAFTSQYYPDAYVSAVYFDGRDLHLVRIADLKAASKELDIEIIPDEQTYSPGDTVTLDVGVSFEGRSAPATVNVSVVDSAMYSLFDGDANIYESVYFSRKYATSLKREISTYSNDKDVHYGEGGGGNGEVRSDFTVTPCFKTVKTDASGHAKVSFKLPDTITSWHITAQAYTADAKAGSGGAEVTSTKDFYIYTTAASGIKASDDAVFPIRFLSSKAADGAQCLYTAELFKNGEVINSDSQTAVIGGIVTKNFGKLEAGDYTLRVTGKSGDSRDTMELPFTVSESTATAYYTGRQVIEGQTGISGEFTTDVTVNVYDEDYEMYLGVTDDLLSHGERRLEQTIGRAVARAVRSGNTEPSYEDLRELSEFETEDGLILFDTAGSMTLEASAFVTAAAGKYFDSDIQISYYEQLLNDGLTDTDALCAYWGLAALGEPVLDDLGSVKTGIAALSDMQKLYLALAYAYAGDHANAREIYSGLSSKLMTANGITEFSADGAYDTEYMSALAAMLAIKLHTPECKSLVKYMLGCEDQTVKREIVLTAFLKDYIPYLGGSNTVTVTRADGSTEKITYLRTGCATVRIPYAEIGGVKFSSDASGSIMSVSGSAKATAVVSGLDPLGADVNVYFEQEQGSDGLAQVQVTAKLPDGYQGDPVLYVELPYPFRIQSVEMLSEGGCSVDRNKKNSQLYIVNGYANAIYHCYVAAAGEFEIEPVYVIDESHGKASAAQAEKVTVQ